jgi:hypothetical protein
MEDKGAENIFDAYLGPKRTNPVNTWDMPEDYVGPNPTIEEVGPIVPNPRVRRNIQDMEHDFMTEKQALEWLKASNDTSPK